jgi:hypothetical protein
MSANLESEVGKVATEVRAAVSEGAERAVAGALVGEGSDENPAPRRALGRHRRGGLKGG